MHTDTLQLVDEWGPEKVVCVSDRRSGMRGVLVIDNSARGVGKGGTRMSPNLSVMEVARLARTMTWKWAGLDMGLTEHDAAIFVDEIGDRGAAVGLPRALGGLPYDELGVTGYGVAETTDAAAAATQPPPDHPRRGPEALPGTRPGRHDAAGTDPTGGR